ncbi:putative F-box protein [Raphanus sativus]|nr:putative F-box protein [Raphanus sativus]
MDRNQHGVTLNGRTYFFARARTNKKYTLGLGMLLCFDYTKERFGQPQPLPVISDEEKNVVLSRVGEDQLAVLYEKWESKVLKIWVTNKIASDEVVSWSKFLKVDTRNIPMDYRTFLFHWDYGSFFIDEEKKVAVVFHDRLMGLSNLHATTAYILGEQGYINSLKIGYSLNVKPSGICSPLVSSSYLPSLVQLNQPKNPSFFFVMQKKNSVCKDYLLDWDTHLFFHGYTGCYGRTGTD